jgi:hypothetical protein
MTLLSLVIMIFFFIVISIVVCHMSHPHHEVCFRRDSSLWARAYSFTRFLDHTTTHHRRLDCSGRVISSSQRPLHDNTQHSQRTDIYVFDGIRTHNFSRRTAADLRLRPRVRWDQYPHEVATHTSKYV